MFSRSSLPSIFNLSNFRSDANESSYKMSSRKSVASSTVDTYDRSTKERSAMWKNDETIQDDTSDTPVDDPETYIPPDISGSPIDVIHYDSPDSDIPGVKKKKKFLALFLVLIVLFCLCVPIYFIIELTRPKTEVDLQPSKPGNPNGTTVTTDITLSMTSMTSVTSMTSTEVTCDHYETAEFDLCQPLSDEVLKCLPTSCAASNISKPRQMALFENIPVVCDTETDGGNWVIIQRRTSNNVSFDQLWNEYANGFGNLCPTGNFWLGLNKVNKICGSAQDQCVIRFDMEYEGKPLKVNKRDDNKYFATYDSFYISDEIDNFRIHLDGYTGTAGDGLVNPAPDGSINNFQFSTRDRDNDAAPTSCADSWGGGGWWYTDCLFTNLNGQWAGPALKGVHWFELTGRTHSLNFVEIKIKHR